MQSTQATNTEQGIMTPIAIFPAWPSPVVS